MSDTETAPETVETAPETAPETVETADEWDGSPDTLEQQSWWASVPEKAREVVLGWKTQGDIVKAVLEADDSLAELARQLDASKQESEGLRKALGEVKSAYEKLVDDIAEQQADREFEELKSKYQDIFDDIYDTQGNRVGADYTGDLGPKGAFMRFLLLRNNGVPDEEAATMARALLPRQEAQAPAQAQAQAEPVPKGIRAASHGGGLPSSVVSAKRRNETIDAALARLKAEAEAEGWG